ncbi:ribosome small subunit-dependent GTPase A [Lutimonas sp.]|uniref:ribosome small subunit-dependent GTPase A n=1 Tax=Lutimonas sp. TaxID=1872403 RepID=UPI003D9B3E34
MTLKDLGYNESLQSFREENNLASFQVGRVILEHKERYIVKSDRQEFDAELIGNLRYTADSRYDYPSVGDWVAFSEYDESKALIHAVYPRFSIIERKAVAKAGQVQIIATNIDVGLIVQAVDRDFNLNRLERYLTICNASKVSPVIVLSKKDLISDDRLQEIKRMIEQRIQEVPILFISNKEHGVDAIKAFIRHGKTYCLLGSSGVGKSTLINSLEGKELMETNEISDSVNKGRHTTSHRELVVLKGGGIVIDNPGMREIGITDTQEGLEITFEAILEFSKDCKYRDCSHVNEDGCGILAALERGEIDEDSYANFRKMEREKQHFESDTLERKRKDKELGKLIKSVVKKRKRDKY